MSPRSELVSRIFNGVPLPVIGVVHALALPESPRFAGSFAEIVDRAMADARSLVEGGVDGLMLENLGDAPYYPARVPAITIAALTTIAVRIRSELNRPLGINVLRNDGQSALAVAACVGARFIRVNVLGGARVTDQGIVTGIAHHLLRERVQLAACDIAILADVDVKHSAPLGPRSLEDEARDLACRQGADALIVTGQGTGLETNVDHLRRVKSVDSNNLVFAGSGASLENVSRLAVLADGLIVGTYFKQNGLVERPVDVGRVSQFMTAIDDLRRNRQQ